MLIPKTYHSLKRFPSNPVIRKIRMKQRFRSLRYRRGLIWQPRPIPVDTAISRLFSSLSSIMALMSAFSSAEPSQRFPLI